ncbi:uncharacterized protein [Clinocottus analis]|uniref:uncharacterized protein n=1 Tax=Clinocottus analis TaxID=304258 RepID=UPI0035BF4EA7
MTVKMKLTTKSDLQDPTIRGQISQQLVAALNLKGVTDAKVLWSSLRKVNVALAGAAAQSSLSDPSLLPSLAVDGKPYSGDGSCASTLRQDDPWWRVDMGKAHKISTIEVTRRSDCCAAQLLRAEIRIGNSLNNNGTNNSRCAVITHTHAVTMVFHCRGMQGRYVAIVLPGANRTLVLCEVKVYAVVKVTGANVALGGVATQSSLSDPSLLPSLAIDGKPYSDYGNGSCVSTLRQENPWWRVDMRGPYDVLSLEIVRRSNCCDFELNGAEIRVGDSLENNGNNNRRCAVITVTQDATMTLPCKARGRYVNIVLRGVNRTLQLCEVKVYATGRITGTNVAFRGYATQSAASASSATAPQKAIDNQPISQYPQQTCASVPQQDDPWWQLDLRTVYRITSVVIISVGHCCPEQLNGAEIRIGLRNDTSNQRCAVISLTNGQSKYIYYCGTMEGRFVHVVLPGRQKTLTVCEVWVYGTVLENVAVRGVAYFQPSSRWKTGSEASRVIDGYRYSTCSIVENEPGQWVTVDLLVPYNVTVIQLAYFSGCCYGQDVRLDNKSCGVPSSSKSVVTVDCGGIVGRYVTVMHPGKSARLCEVEVYSTWINLRNIFPQRPPPSDHCAAASCSRDYVLIRSEPKTWFEAQTYCRERFHDLASINNVQDMNAVVDKMENHFGDFWIGLYDDAVTWGWSLSDEGHYGRGEAEFRNWGEGEPGSERRIQHCTGVEDTGEWKALDCDLLHSFLCFDGRTGAKESKILVETAMKWADARRHCREHHTDLLSVRNQPENLEIQSMVPTGRPVWIGLFGDSWKWSDGSGSSFRYWSQGPINSSAEGPKCAHVHDRKWSASSCNTKSMFLCYYRVVNKRSVVKIRANFDMSVPVVRQQILSQLEAAMKKKGMSDVKIRWRTSVRVTHKTDTTQFKPAEEC